MGFWNDGFTSSRPRSRSRHSSSSKRTYYYSSSSRAQPSRTFTNRLMSRLRRFIRDLYHYMRRHPLKVFILVIMPLLTGGALTKILAQFGVRLPRGLEELVGGSRGGMRGYQKERYYARGGARDFGSGSSLPGMGAGMGQSLQGLLKVAKMFV